MIDSQRIKNTFDEDGIIVLRSFFDEATTNNIRHHVERYIRDVMPGMPREEVYFEKTGDETSLKQLQKMHEYDTFFKDLFISGALPDLAAILFDCDAVPRNMQYFNKPPGIGRATPVHQDGYYFKIEPKEAVTMWLALDEVSEENGCLRYVKGAHKEGVRPHQRTKTLGFSQGLIEYSDTDKENEVMVTASPGDLIVHHCLMVHRADGNTSNRSRRALGFIYYSARAKENTDAVESYQQGLIKDLKHQGKI